MLELKDIRKIYQNGDVETRALDGVSLTFGNSEFVAVLGPSGCGKTTLLNIIGGLDRYTSGDLVINGTTTKDFKDREWDAYRNHSVGFVFQNYNLIHHISILENVELGMTLSGVSFEERRRKAIEVLTKVGLEDQLYKKSSQLSGGQKQRVAIARALANDPDIILADEPTGALDSVTSKGVMELIQKIAKEKLVIMVTHNEDIANSYANRIIKLKDGQVIENEQDPKSVEKERGYHPNATAMKFSTAIKLSFNNLKTKFGRTLITAFAGSIGIIGVALVLAISNGFQGELSSLEEETLSTLPITITEFPTTFRGGPPVGVNDDQYNDTNVFDPITEDDLIEHTNVIDDDYLNYLENIDDKFVSSIQYSYGIRPLMIFLDNGEYYNTFDENIMPIELSNSDAYLEGQFSLEAGEYPTEATDVVIIVDVLNRIDANIIRFLGLDPNANIDFNQAIGKTIRVANNDDINLDFSNLLSSFVSRVDEDTYNNGINLTVVGVLKGVADGLETETSGLYYNDGLDDIFIENNIDSDVCADLSSTEIGDLFPDERTKKSFQHMYGCIDTPQLIRIYPASFDEKDEVLSYLDEYNIGLSEEDQVIYTDLAQQISGLLGSVISNVSLVLVAFAAVSLVVSSIMIGIITYVSVLERTKEIGILRSLGARKKDISRVFNAESSIIGFFAGVLGISITFILSFPLNNLLKEQLTGFGNIVILRADHALYLIIVSISLTFIAGLIPARIAANKDPVKALRHNE